MIPIQQLDLDPEHLTTRTADILRWLRDPSEGGYMPQTNIGSLPLWNPADPYNPANNQARPDWGKTIQASEVSAVLPNNAFKQNTIRSGLQVLRDAAKAEGLDQKLAGMIFVETHLYGFHFDNPVGGYTEPSGWKWEWCLRVPMATAWTYLGAWLDAGWSFARTRTVEEALKTKNGGGKGWPFGWSRTRPGNVIEQYEIAPDLRIPECRAWLVQRVQSVMADFGTKRANLAMKTGWFHPAASVRSTPQTPRNMDPWLPSPYPGDSYRDANSALASELAAAIGGPNVTCVNTAMNYEASVPAYCRERWGGIVAPIYGYWITNLLMSHRWFSS